MKCHLVRKFFSAPLPICLWNREGKKKEREKKECHSSRTSDPEEWILHESRISLKIWRWLWTVLRKLLSPPTDCSFTFTGHFVDTPRRSVEYPPNPHLLLIPLTLSWLESTAHQPHWHVNFNRALSKSRTAQDGKINAHYFNTSMYNTENKASRIGEVHNPLTPWLFISRASKTKSKEGSQSIILQK